MGFDDSRDQAESAMKAPEPPAEEWEEVHVEDLVSELEGLRAQVYELQAKNAQLEEVVREEVCEEMMRNIEEMERAFQVRIEDERITTEQKFERKLEIITRELTRRECALSQEEMGEVIAQLNFYKARVDEMQRDHKASLQRLMPAGQARDEATAEQGEGQQQQQQAQFLAAQVAKLQKELEDKNEALDSKRKQQNESRLVLEEADSVIRQLEQRVKCAEEQNDRLREELAQARGAGARLNEERHRSQADWEAKLQEVEARRVRTVGELEGKVERERVEKEEMRLRVDALQGMLERYDEVLTKKQKMDVLKKSSEGGGFTFSLGSWRGGAATVHGDSPARSGSKPTGGFSALKNIFSPKTDVPPPLDKPDSSRQQHSLKRKSSEGEPPSMAPKVPSVAAARPKESKKGCNSELDNCPVHLLAYMLPDDDSYARGSPLHKRAPLSPAGNSVVNIKANAPAVSGPHKEEVSSTCRAVKTRKLFNLSLEEAEELNNAAGAALVEGTPMQRRLRSSSKANGLMC